MKILGLLTALAVFACAPLMHAQKLEGKDAPDFSMGGVVNPYGPTDFDDMKGDVIVLKVWGIT